MKPLEVWKALDGWVWDCWECHDGMGGYHSHDEALYAALYHCHLQESS